MSTLQNNAILVSLSISQYAGRKKDKEVTEKTNADYNADPDAGAYSKALLPKKALEPIRHVVTEARKYHYANTLPWSDNKERLLPAKHTPEYRQKMAAFKADFDIAVQEFAANFDQYVSDAQAILGTMFDIMDYPVQAAVEEAFGFKVDYTTITDVEDFRVALSDQEKDEITQQIRQTIEDKQAKANQHLWYSLYNVIENMVKKLSANPEDTKYFQTMVTNIEDLVKILPSLNFDDDDRLNDLADVINTKLCGHSAKDLKKDEDLRKETKQNAQEILNTMASFMGGAPLPKKTVVRREEEEKEEKEEEEEGDEAIFDIDRRTTVEDEVYAD